MKKPLAKEVLTLLEAGRPELRIARLLRSRGLTSLEAQLELRSWLDANVLNGVVNILRDAEASGRLFDKAYDRSARDLRSRLRKQSN